MIQTLKLPGPHGPKQKIVMNAFMMHGVKEVFVACGTKFGKSLGVSCGLSAKAWVSQGGLYRWVAPIYSQSKIGFKYISKLLPPRPFVDVHKGEPSITICGTQTKIEFRSGKNPEDLEGEGPNGYVLDEAAKMKEQVFYSAKTTLSVTRGPIVAISTPYGKNWFYNKCMEANDEMLWALRNGKEPTKIFLTAPSTDNPMVLPSVVEQARREMPERLFLQYYQAEFMDDGAVFAGYKDCLFGEKLKDLIGDNQKWFAPEAKESVVVVGADWAKVADYTVFTAFDLNTARLVGYARFHKVPYTEAVRRLVLFCRKFRDVYVVLHDKTGVGSAIDDQLAYTKLPAHGVTFTNSLKAEMVAKLVTSVEQRLIALPHIPDMVAELDAFEVTATTTGLLSYNAPEGLHDDIVCSLMLSHMALLQYGDRDMAVSVMERPDTKDDAIKSAKDDKPDTRNPIEVFYNALDEDDDDD